MVISLALAAVIGTADAPPEIDIVARSLRAGARPEIEKALGPLVDLPLYRIEVVVDPIGRTVTGREELVLPAAGAPPAEVVLRTWPNGPAAGVDRPLELVECKVGRQAAKTQAPGPTLVRVSLGAPGALPGRTALDVLFRLQIPELSESADSFDSVALGALGGAFGGGNHGLLGASKDGINLGGFYPALATRAEGAFSAAEPSSVGDTPTGDPSNFVVSVLAPTNWVVAGAGVEVGRTPAAGNQTRTTLVAAAVRDFGLFLSDKYVETSVESRGVRLRAYTVAEDAEEGRKVLDVAKRSFEFFESRFGTYPWAELKVVESAFAGGAGGVEYPTVVGVASMLYRAKRSQVLSMLPRASGADGLADAMLEGAVAHEVAHQWWMAIVGNDAQAHPFVDEPLAQYSSAMYVENRRGAKAYESFMKVQIAGSYHAWRMLEGADGPVERPAADFADEREYGGLVYGKAAAFHRAARKLLGDKAFFESLRRYAKDRYLRVAGPDHLADAVAKVSPAKAKSYGVLRRRWLRESHGDEDLGPLDVGDFFSGMTGAALDPTTRQLLQQMMPMLEKTLGGRSAYGPGTSAPPQQTDPDAP